jgi:hypothetical protein
MLFVAQVADPDGWVTIPPKKKKDKKKAAASTAAAAAGEPMDEGSEGDDA